MKMFLIILTAIIGFNVCALELKAESKTDRNPFEQEIRAIICEIENGNYTSAQAKLEEILQKDPQNIYARRLWPGVVAHQVKKEDQSPENIVRMRKAVEAFEQALKNMKVSAKQRIRLNSFLQRLYETIRPEETNAFLLKKSEDTSLPPEDRSLFYTSRAAKLNTCANDISEDPAVKKGVKKGGKWVFSYTKPKRTEDFNKLKECATKGLELIDKAIEFENQSEIAWSYKTSLLIQKTRVAEMDRNLREKESLKKESEAARARFIEISNKKRNDRLDEDKKELDKINDLAKKQPDIEENFKELTFYKIERPLDSLIPEIYIPDNYLILVDPVSDEPPPPPIDKNGKILREKNANVKGEWKLFSPNGEFSAQLPDNAQISMGGGETAIYDASSEDVNFMIMAQPRPAAQSPEINDNVLNTLAWAMGTSIRDLAGIGGQGNSFEIKFVRKETLSGQPARIYTYQLGSCKGNTDGMLIVMIGKKHNYGISINGANEKDPRTQRFLKSLKING